MPEQQQRDLTPRTKGVFLGFDFGEKRIGIASGHSVSRSATPLATIRNINGRPEWDRIDTIISQWQPEGVVIGLPTHDAFSEPQPIELAAKAFARRLSKRYGLQSYLHNESYSSNEAGRIVARNRRHHARRKTRNGDIDKIAAALILEHWLNENPL